MSDATGTGTQQGPGERDSTRLFALRRAPWALAVLAIAAVGLVATGCGGDDDDEGDTTTTAEQTTTDEAQTTTEAEDTGAGGGEGDAAAGEQVFADNCASCHGEDGSGGTGPSLQNPSLDHARVSEQVENGGGGMPPFGDQLSAQQISDVAAYVVEDIAQG